jgi:hypothetical protein
LVWENGVERSLSARSSLLEVPMSFFWPTRSNPYPGFFGRIGQLIHLGATVLAILLFVAFANPQSFDSPQIGLFYAALVYMSGRAVRFLFAGE